MHLHHTHSLVNKIIKQFSLKTKNVKKNSAKNVFCNIFFIILFWPNCDHTLTNRLVNTSHLSIVEWCCFVFHFTQFVVHRNYIISYKQWKKNCISDGRRWLANRGHFGAAAPLDSVQQTGQWFWLFLATVFPKNQVNSYRNAYRINWKEHNWKSVSYLCSCWGLGLGSFFQFYIFSPYWLSAYTNSDVLAN